MINAKEGISLKVYRQVHGKLRDRVSIQEHHQVYDQVYTQVSAQVKRQVCFHTSFNFYLLK